MYSDTPPLVIIGTPEKNKLCLKGQCYTHIIRDSEKKQITIEEYEKIRISPKKIKNNHNFFKISESQAFYLQNFEKGKLPIYDNHNDNEKKGTIVEFLYNNEKKFLEVIAIVTDEKIIILMLTGKLRYLSIGINQHAKIISNSYVINDYIIPLEVSIVEEPFDKECITTLLYNKKEENLFNNNIYLILKLNNDNDNENENENENKNKNNLKNKKYLCENKNIENKNFENKNFIYNNNNMENISNTSNTSNPANPGNTSTPANSANPANTSNPANIPNPTNNIQSDLPKSNTPASGTLITDQKTGPTEDDIISDLQKNPTELKNLVRGHSKILNFANHVTGSLAKDATDFLVSKMGFKTEEIKDFITPSFTPESLEKYKIISNIKKKYEDQENLWKSQMSEMEKKYIPSMMTKSENLTNKKSITNISQNNQEQPVITKTIETTTKLTQNKDDEDFLSSEDLQKSIKNIKLFSRVNMDQYIQGFETGKNFFSFNK